MELESILLPGIEAKRPIVIAGPCSARGLGDVYKRQVAQRLKNK